MYATRRSTSFTFSFLLLSVILFGFAYAADDKNPESCNRLFGFLKGTMSMEASKKIMNAKVCGAYEFLISRHDPGPRSSQGLSNPKVEGVLKLNPDFAVALANMLQSEPLPLTFRINSAFRVDNPNSNHYKGCAVDLQYGCPGRCSQDHCESPGCKWTLANSGRFGLQIRMKYGPEWNHIEPANLRACQTKGPGVGDPVAAPSSPLSTAIRNAINPQPAPQPLPQQTSPASPPPPLGTQNTTPYQAGTCAPQFYCSNNNLYYRTSSCVDQINQVCPKGCSGTSCVDAPVSTDVLTTLLSTSTKPTPTNTGTATKTVSVFEQLSAFAGTQAQPTKAASGAPLVLIITNKDSVSLQSQQPAPSTTPQGVAYQLAPTQQTFVSPDLSGSPAASQYSPQQASGFQSALANLKNILLRALEYLKPFGGRVATPDIESMPNGVGEEY